MFRQRRVTPFESPGERLAAGRFGMALFLISLAMLFAAVIVGCLVIRLSDSGNAWRPEGSPPMPWLLWVSTGIMVASSATFYAAAGAARAGRALRFQRLIWTTWGLGVAFISTQAWSWVLLHEGNRRLAESLYAWSFYVLTGIHAAHVVGGLVPLTVVAVHARREHRDPAGRAGLTYVEMYWHFLGVAWLVLFAVLLLVA